MALTNDQLEMRFTANMRDVERELKRFQQINDRAANRLAQAHQSAATKSARAWQNSNISGALERQLQGVGAMVARVAPVIASMFAGREALNAAESWTKFNNSLRVAGVSAGSMKLVQDALYQSAIKNGVALEPLAQLYGRLAQSQGELGASQAQLLTFTNGVTAALRVQGGDASNASGALLQLSQALAAGTVRAEEWNSINEGARPILEAVARGWAKQGTSVAKLRAIMMDGKLSSQEFFQAFLRGAGSLETQAAKSTLTVGQAMTNIHTALTKYIGEADQSNGVTMRISEALGWLARNLDTVAESLKVVGTLYAATFIPAMARASAGIAALVTQKVAAIVASGRLIAFQTAMTASMTGMSRAATVGTVAMRGLSATMGFFGGPIGIAIIGITAALGYMGVSSAKAALEADNLQRATDGETASIKAAKDAAAAKNAETGKLTPTQMAAAVAAARLSGEVDKLKDKYWLAAAAAKALRLEQAKAALEGSVERVTKSRAGFRDRLDKELGKEQARATVDPRVPGVMSAEARNRAYSRALQSNEGKLFSDNVSNAQYNAGELNRIKADKLAEYAPAPTSGTGGVGGGGKPKGGGGSKSKPQDNNDNALQRADDLLFAARQASAITEEQRNAVAVEALGREIDAANREIDQQLKEGTITAATAEKAKADIESARVIKLATQQREHEAAVIAERLQVDQIRAELDGEGLRQQAEALDLQSDATTDLRQRHKLQREALTLRQQADDVAFKVQQDQLALDREKLGLTQAQIQEMREQAERNRNSQRTNERGSLDARQSDEKPRGFKDQIKDAADGWGDIDTQFANMAKGGIADLSNGLADAVMGANPLKAAFTDMARAIIKQLIEMAVRFLIFEAIGMAFGTPGLGKASLGIKRNALGSDNFGGGLTTVGEHGRELAWLPGGTQILPNNSLRQAFRPGSMARGGGSGVVNINTTVNAQDAVLTGQVKQWIGEANAKAVVAAKQVTMNAMHKQNRNALVR